MKLREAIERIDSLKHNTFTQGEKVEWLNRLDGLVKTQIIDTHEGAEEVEFSGYSERENMETELLVPAPYDDVYMRWLEAQIDYYNGEIARYNNSMAMYQAAFDDYERFYNRTHMPIGIKNKYFGGTPTQISKPAQSIFDIEIREV
jgi:hypothetical protein